MSKITTIVNNIISKVNEHTTDVLALETLNSNHINLSGVTAYHLLGGNLSVDATVLTNGFNTTLYTGNGSTQSINTGIDMDTQWGNDASETFGGLVLIKNRGGVFHNLLSDTVRGADNYIYSSSTSAKFTYAGSETFTPNGFSVTGTGSEFNANLATYVSWNFQTTHRISGVTNHGKAYTCHYNPFTGFTIVKYEGSGIAGHEIPHHLGRELELRIIKNLSAATDWECAFDNTTNGLSINNTAGIGTYSNSTVCDDTSVTLNSPTARTNVSGQQHILYGWANSYFDESGKLIGNFEIGVYQGTGVAGNKVTTRGKLAWVMIKRIDATGSWGTFDVKRNEISGANDGILFLNLADAEVSNANVVSFVADGFILNNNSGETNVSGGQYLYFGVYDNDSGSGKSKYPKATDTANVQINNGIIPLAHGIDSNGSKNSIVVANETITGVTYTEGKNYLYKTDTGYGVKAYEPRYLASELVRKFAGEQPDYYDVESNKWFNCDAGTELVTNGTFSSGVTTGWTNNIGHTQIIENGNLKVTSISGAFGQSYQNITTIIGKKYKVRFAVNNVSMVSYGLVIDDVLVKNTTGAFSGIVEHTFIANATTSKIGLITNPSATGQVIYFDTVTCFAYDIMPTTEITESRNYLNHIVHADNDGGVLYVEELPKIEYKNVIKADEYLGKNACTAWANIDITTTPPTIRDSYNFSTVIRTATGQADLYFEEEMDRNDYSQVVSINGGTDAFAFPIVSSAGGYNQNLNTTKYCKISALMYNASAWKNCSVVMVHIFGGRN